MRPEFDAIIVGAGLIGAACALALTRAGLRVTLIDRRADPGTPAATGDVRALVLAPASTTILHDLDLWPQLAPHAHPIQHIQVSDRGG